MGFQDNFYPRMQQRAATTQQRLTEQELIQAAHDQDEADRWVQLDNNLKYILVNILSGPAENNLQTTPSRDRLWDLQAAQHLIFHPHRHTQRWLPHTTSQANIRLQQLRRLLLNMGVWALTLYERDKNAQLPDAVKIAVLLNNTTGPLQQHLQLNAGANPTYAEVRATIMEYYRTTTAFQKLQQTNPSSAVATHFGGGQAPMDIGAINKGKYKGKSKGKHKGKYGNNKGYKGKGYNKGKGYGNNYNSFGNKGGKGKIGQGMPFRGMRNNKRSLQQRQRKRIQQRQRRYSRMLQVWPTRSHCQRLQDDSLQHQRYNRQQRHLLRHHRPVVSATTELLAGWPVVAGWPAGRVAGGRVAGWLVVPGGRCGGGRPWPAVARVAVWWLSGCGGWGWLASWPCRDGEWAAGLPSACKPRRLAFRAFGGSYNFTRRPVA